MANIVDDGRVVIGYRQMSSVTTATVCPLAHGKQVHFQAEAQSIRYRLDGVAPTAAIGVLVPAGESVCFTGDLTKLQFIEVATGAKINLHVFE